MNYYKVWQMQLNQILKLFNNIDHNTSHKHGWNAGCRLELDTCQYMIDKRSHTEFRRTCYIHLKKGMCQGKLERRKF